MLDDSANAQSDMEILKSSCPGDNDQSLITESQSWLLMTATVMHSRMTTSNSSIVKNAKSSSHHMDCTS